MSSTWELKEKSTGELTATVEGDTWKDAQKKAFRKLAKKVNLPGFRPGQAPEKLVRKQISSQNILMEAIDEVAGDALSAGIKEHDLWVISRPALDIESIDEDKVTFKFNVTVKPEVKLGAYKGLDITKEAVEVSDADVEEEITRLQERFADLVVKEEGKVENGDTAVIDFEGFKEGVAFEGGKGEAYPLVIGSGSFIPGFEEQVLGMGIEETKDINVTFPEDYQAEELAGKAAVFKCTVHAIKAKELPELDDEFASEVSECETMDDYRAEVKTKIKERKEREGKQKKEDQAVEQAVANAEMDLPKPMIDLQTKQMADDFARRIAQQGLTVEQYFQFTGLSEEKMMEEMEPQAEKRIRTRLVLEAIVKAENIEVTDERLDEELQKMADAYQMEVEKLKEFMGENEKAQMKEDIAVQDAVTLITEAAVEA